MEGEESHHKRHLDHKRRREQKRVAVVMMVMVITTRTISSKRKMKRDKGAHLIPVATRTTMATLPFIALSLLVKKMMTIT